MTHESYWHVMDRITAVPCMILEIIKYYYMVCNALRLYEKQYRKEDPQRTRTFLCFSTVVSTFFYGGFLLYAIYCYVQSQHAQEHLNRSDFCYWHTMWHCFPIFGSCTILIHSYMHDHNDWYSQKNQTQQRTIATRTPIVHENQSQKIATRNKNRRYIINRAYAVKLINLEKTIVNE